jgi:hypothetical protein
MPSWADAGVAAALLQRVLAAQQPRLRSLDWQDRAPAADAGSLTDVLGVLMRHAPRMPLRLLSLYFASGSPSSAGLLAVLEGASEPGLPRP